MNIVIPKEDLATAARGQFSGAALSTVPREAAGRATCGGCLQQPLATACRNTNWSRSHEQPKGRRRREAGRRVQGHHRGGARLMVGYNLMFWLLMVAIVALLMLVATSFEGMHLETTGGPGRIL